MSIVVEAAARLVGELAINIVQTWLLRRPAILLTLISLVLLASAGHAISAIGTLVGVGFLALGLVAAGWAAYLALRGREARGTSGRYGVSPPASVSKRSRCPPTPPPPG